MRIQSVLKLRGPNIWANFPVLEAWVDLEELKDTHSAMIPGFNDRIMAWLPSMIEHRCGIGERGGFFLRLRDGTYMGHILEHVTLELQSLAGTPVGFGRARESSVPGVFKVAIEYADEQVGLAAVDAAFELIQAAIHDSPFDVEAEVTKLRDLAHNVCLGPSTGSIVEAAKKRGIPTFRLNEDSLVQLGTGSHQRRINAAETCRTSALAEMIAQDKQLTRQLLTSVGVSVPQGRVVTDAEDAWRAAEELGVPVVVKPQFGNHGRGVAINLTSRDQILAAYDAAKSIDPAVVVEHFIAGDDYRLLVVGNRLIAAARREPAHVIGNGTSTVRQLVETTNRDPRRSDGHATVLSLIKLDASAIAVLAEQGYTPDTIVESGAKVLIRRNANLSSGGTATDVTDEVHPDVARQAIDAVRVVGLDIGGLDIIARDITKPLTQENGVVVEINAQPGLRMHLQPSAGKPRPVGEAIIEMLFPEGQTGRIPVVAVTGVNGKTTTTRLVSHIVASTGRRVGMTCTDGIYIGGRCIDKDDCAGPQSARSVLMNPLVDVAVLETARGGILRAGLAFDLCDVAIVTNIGEGDHLGMSDINTPEQLAKVKRCIVEALAPTGTAVLNAQDPLTAAMIEKCPGDTIFFARDGHHPLLVERRRQGRRVAFVRDNAVMLADGATEFTLLSLERIPLTQGGRITFQVENVLAAAAACWALGIPAEQIRNGLQTFSSQQDGSPGRFNVYQSNGATMIVDYGHNTSSLVAVLDNIKDYPHKFRTVVYTTAGDRRDCDITRQAELLGDAFDRVILYEDHYRRGRVPGEITKLFRKGLEGTKRVAEIREAHSWAEAVSEALRLAQPGELLLAQADQIEETVEHMNRLLAAGTIQPVTREQVPFAVSKSVATNVPSANGVAGVVAS